MSIHYKSPISSIALILFLFSPLISMGQTNISVIEDKTYLYSQPNTNSSIHIVAQKGDVFNSHKTQGEWFQIDLFSGAKWYIKNTQVEIIKSIPDYPSDSSTRNKVCMEAKKAQKEATEKAMANYPNDISQQAVYEKTLFDKNLLEVFRNFEIPTSHTSKLVECVNDGIFQLFKIDN